MCLHIKLKLPRNYKRWRSLMVNLTLNDIVFNSLHIRSRTIYKIYQGSGIFQL
jgi:hypothetical protein